MTFRTRILLPTVGLLLIVIVGILVAMQSMVRREVLSRLAADLDSTAQAVQDQLHSNEARLRAEARVVAEEPRLKAVISTPEVDRATRDDVAKELRGAIGWDVLGLFDPDGTMASLIAPPGLSATPPEVAEALERGVVEGFWFDGGRLFQIAAVRLGFRAETVGVLLAGTELSDARATELGRQTHSTLAFVVEGKVVASSLDPSERSELGKLASGSLPEELTLSGERFLTRTVTVRGGQLRVAVLESAEAAFAPYVRLQRGVIAIGAAALLLALLLAGLLAQGWSRPIARLVELAHSVKAGNLEARVKPSGGTELATLASTLNEMVAEIARQRRRDELASYLVHDLKNPLTSVLGFAQLLEVTKGMPDGTQEFVRALVTSSETMLSMVMDMLDVGKDGDGVLVPKKEVFDVHALVEQVRREGAGRARQRKVEVATQLEGPRTLRADRELVRRVLENLLDNAFKYAPKAGKILISERQSAEGQIELRVSDDGPGVPQAYRARIFDKYFRLDRDAANQTRTSRGLGLVFCRVAVEAHGGRIWVEDNAPSGSAFCVSLPAGT